MPIRREHGIEHLLDEAVTHDESEPTQELLPSKLEGRQAEAIGPRSIGIAQQFERKMEPLDGLALRLRGVRADAVHLRSEGAKVRMMVSERTRLGRATAGPGDAVPFLRRRRIGS